MTNKISDIFANKRNTKLLVFLLVLIMLIEYILSNALHRDHMLDDKIANHFLTDFSMTETNNRGEISWTLDGVKLEKFPNSERSEVKSPSMKIFSVNDGYWTVTAKKALDPDSLFKSIYLYGDVNFIKHNESNNVEIDIKTESAVIYPDKEIVETEKFGIIETPDSTTSGEGIVADIKNGYVKILSKAKRISFEDDKTGKIQSEKLIYNINNRTWKALKKESKSKSMIKERVKTILKTRKNYE